MITTLLVDDEPLAREGLRVALRAEPDLEVVGEAGDGPSAVQQIRDKALSWSCWTYRCPGWTGFRCSSV